MALSLSSSNVGTNSATLNWSVSGISSTNYAWDVFISGSGGTIATSGFGPYSVASGSGSTSVTGLSPGTTYTYNIDLTLQNGNVGGGSAQTSFTTSNPPPPPTYPPGTLSGSLGNGQQGVAYSASVSTTNMNYSGTWSSGGTLPPGLSLSNTAGSNTNTLSGTPTAAGTYSFSITATNSYGSATGNYSVVIAAPSTFPPVWSDNVLANFVVNQAYSDGVTATNMASYSGVYSVSAGSLPAGISLNTSTGAVTGTPTAAAAYSFTITATNTYSSVSQAFSGNVNGGMSYYDGSLWTKKTVKVYNGTSWATGTVYVYNGTSWVASQ